MPRRRRPVYDVAFYMPRMTAMLTEARAPGGAERQVFLIARALVKRGMRVAVIPEDAPGLPSEVDGVAVVPRSPLSVEKPRRLGGAAETFQTVRALARVPSRTVVFRQAGVETFVVAAFARLTRRRFVWSASNTLDFRWETHIASRRDNMLYDLGIKLAHQLVVQTDEQAELCRSRYGREPMVIANIVDEAPLVTKPSTFLWVSRVVDYKGPLRYVELARRFPEGRFRMVATPGDEELGREVERQAAELDNLEVIGPVRHAELMELAGEAVALVNTSDFEGMPNSVLEGWARGVPALMLHVDPDGLVERHGTGAFAAGDFDRFVEQARGLWEARSSPNGVAERCRAYIQAHHSDRVVGEAWARAVGPSSIG